MPDELVDVAGEPRIRELHFPKRAHHIGSEQHPVGTVFLVAGNGDKGFVLVHQTLANTTGYVGDNPQSQRHIRYHG